MSKIQVSLTGGRGLLCQKCSVRTNITYKQANGEFFCFDCNQKEKGLEPTTSTNLANSWKHECAICGEPANIKTYHNERWLCWDCWDDSYTDETGGFTTASKRRLAATQGVTLDGLPAIIVQKPWESVATIMWKGSGHSRLFDWHTVQRIVNSREGRFTSRGAL